MTEFQVSQNARTSGIEHFLPMINPQFAVYSNISHTIQFLLACLMIELKSGFDIDKSTATRRYYKSN